MTELLLLAVLVLGILLADTRTRLKRLERMGVVASRPPSNRAEESPAPAVLERPAPLAPTLAPRPAPATSPPLPSDPEPRPKRRSVQFEDLAGKRLPIWIGGVALACAGFFLVRYSIELGLFGPAARSALAAVFGLLLLALAEVGPALPRIGASFAADRRLAQALAGAGIATLYGTLYMAAELYALIGLGLGFALVVAVTALALYLSQRHGPPTALLGLGGGYLAPYLAGLPDSSLAITAIYLATFTAGLLGLALYRGWTWLAWAATGANLVWTVSLLATAEPGERSVVGVLVAGIAIAASAVLARSPVRLRRLPLALPLAGGTLQLAVLAAVADFSPLAWSLFLALSLAALILARRHAELIPATWACLAAGAATVLGDLAGEPLTPGKLLAPAILALLFGGAGQAWAFRGPGGRAWASLAAAAPAIILAAVGFAAANPGWAPAWGCAALAAAMPAALIVRRADRIGDRETAAVGVAVAVAAGVAAAGFLLPAPLHPAGFAVLAVALVQWRRPPHKLGNQPLLVLVILAGLGILLAVGGLAAVPLRAVAGARLHYPEIPPLGGLAMGLALPGAILLTAGWSARHTRHPAWAAMLAGGLALAGFAFALVKQPLAIADEPAFVRWGLLERALLTQALVAAGWWLMRGKAWATPAAKLGVALAGIGLFRFVWFDLLILNPVLVRQAIPGVPLLNLATLHTAAMAAWLWVWADQPAGRTRAGFARLALRWASLATMVVAVLVTVRHAVQGPIIAVPSLARTENYFISVGLLVLALAWLTVGIRQRIALVRIAGLALLTVVTLKVFLVDAAALAGLLRVLSFLGLGAALIGIGWAYGRISPGARPDRVGPAGALASSGA